MSGRTALIEKARHLVNSLQHGDLTPTGHLILSMADALESLPAAEWEYGVIFPEFRSDASFVGAEDSARYFMSRPASAIDKHATDSDKRILVRRVKAGPWIEVTP